MGYLDSNAMSGFKANQANSQNAAQDALQMQQAAFGSQGGAQGNQQWTGSNPLMQDQLANAQLQANDPVAFNRLMAQEMQTQNAPRPAPAPQQGGGGALSTARPRGGFGVSFTQGGPVTNNPFG